jgi:cell division protein FtsN
MAAAIIELGPARCPLCGGTAKARLSGKGLAYLVMDCCNAQLFTRSGKSDELARSLIRPATPGAVTPQVRPEPVRTEKPAPTPAPAPIEPVRTTAPAPKQQPPAPPAPASQGFGLMKGWL